MSGYGDFRAVSQPAMTDWLQGGLGKFRYGGGSSLLPNWVDIAVVIVFSIVIFYWSVSLALTPAEAATAVAKDARQINYKTLER